MSERATHDVVVEQTQPQPDADGWIEHDGTDEPPVSPHVVVEIRDKWQKDSQPTDTPHAAYLYVWSDITHYRLAEPQPIDRLAAAVGVEVVTR